MRKIFVLLNTNNGQYWTGRYWDAPYTYNPQKAKHFASDEEIDNELSPNSDFNDSIQDLLAEVQMFEVKTFYTA